MDFRILNKSEVRTIYQNHLVNDFPADEVKPLEVILDGMEKKSYQCFGMMENGKWMSYAFVAFGEGTTVVMLDYLAVASNFRGKGFGSRMLTEIVKYYGFVKTKSHMIVEAESVESTTDLKTIRTRENRIHFYQKNGLYLDEWNRPVIAGVEYRLLYLRFPQYTLSMEDGDKDRMILVPESPSVDDDLKHREFLDAYVKIYKTMLTEEMYQRAVDLSGCRIE